MCLGEIVRLESVSAGTATGHIGTRAVTVSLLTLDRAVAPGDWVVVHSGFALQRLEPDEAAEAIALRGGGTSPTADHPQEES